MKTLSWIAVAAGVTAASWAFTIPSRDVVPAETFAVTQPDRQWPEAEVNTMTTNVSRSGEDVAHEKTLEAVNLARYQSCRRYMERNYKRLRSARQAAMECHMGPDFLGLQFQHYAHETPEEYLQDLKLAHTGNLPAANASL